MKEIFNERSFYQEHDPIKKIRNNFKDYKMLLGTDYPGQIASTPCNGEIITFQLIQQEQWLKTLFFMVKQWIEFHYFLSSNLKKDQNISCFYLICNIARNKTNKSCHRIGQLITQKVQIQRSMLIIQSFQKILQDYCIISKQIDFRCLSSEFLRDPKEIVERQHKIQNVLFTSKYNLLLVAYFFFMKKWGGGFREEVVKQKDDRNYY
ncbi:unnamed protein product [Paramecium sonneborni]|uniref:Uncharacterized protein n=1 Tax=Paramecium sonneborni TaxID=65129 RepID=A0A8S1RP16_9CILI|nr:unnamed protein product [Paramecium sonneborni]